jgi:hypothetical protein
LMMSRIATLPWNTEVIPATICCGTCIKVRTLENAIAAAMINRIGA